MSLSHLDKISSVPFFPPTLLFSSPLPLPHTHWTLEFGLKYLCGCVKLIIKSHVLLIFFLLLFQRSFIQNLRYQTMPITHSHWQKKWNMFWNKSLILYLFSDNVTENLLGSLLNKWLWKESIHKLWPIFCFDLTCPYLTCFGLPCLDLTCLYLTFPDLTSSDLSFKFLYTPPHRSSHRYPQDILQTPLRPPTDTCQTPVRKPSDNFKRHSGRQISI